jgi:hypothetical protein
MNSKPQSFAMIHDPSDRREWLFIAALLIYFL